jgi:hypothetical protein
VLRGDLLDFLVDGEAGFAHRSSLGCDGPARYPSLAIQVPADVFSNVIVGAGLRSILSSQPELQSTRQGSR